jgi:cell wall-associated NlpC family hydrolase
LTGTREQETTQQEHLIDRRLFIGSATALTLFGLFSPLSAKNAFAAPTSAEKQAEADEVAAKLSEWNKLLDEALRNYYAAIDAHDAAVAKMEEVQAHINIVELKEAELQKHLGGRATSMYKQGPMSFFEVLFGARSFTEFTSSWDLMNQVNTDNARMIDDYKKVKAEAIDAQEEYAIQEQIAEQKQAEAEEIKAEAEAIVAAYEAELAALEDEVRELVRQEEEAEALRKAEAARLLAEANTGSNSKGASGSGSSSTGSDSAESGYTGSGESSYPAGSFSSVVAAAQSQIGVPYRWGGSTAGVGFDCSGLTQWCYSQVGIYIPRTDSGQYGSAPNRLPLSEAQPGDILWTSGHVGICTAYGGGQYIHAPSPGQAVSYSSWPQFVYALRW